MLADGSEEPLRRAIAESGDESPEVRIAAPTRVGPLEWLATDEDDARREADARALAAEWLLIDQADVDAEAGDVDPVLAVEDALRSFPADEILILGGASEDGGLEALLRQFDLPTTRLGGPVPQPGHPQLRQMTRAIVPVGARQRHSSSSSASTSSCSHSRR